MKPTSDLGSIQRDFETRELYSSLSLVENEKQEGKKKKDPFFWLGEKGDEIFVRGLVQVFYEHCILGIRLACNGKTKTTKEKQERRCKKKKGKSRWQTRQRRRHLTTFSLGLCKRLWRVRYSLGQLTVK